MQKVLIIGSLSDDPGETEALGRLQDTCVNGLQAVDTQASVSFCHLDEIGYIVNETKAVIYDYRNQCLLTDYQLLVFRGKLQARMNDVALLSNFAALNNIKTLNSAHQARRATGKVPQMYQLRQLGLPFPATVAGHARYMAQLIDDNLQYPVVLKDQHGSHGNNNYLIADRTELEAALSASPAIDFMAQEMIPNDCDYRVLIAGDHERIIRRAGIAGSHLNNTSQGAKATLVNASAFSGDILSQARTFASFCMYELAGVDVIIHKKTGRHYFLEINSQPQVASGAFVAEKTIVVGEMLRDILGSHAGSVR